MSKWPHQQINSVQGPWPCEECHELSQFCEVGQKLNYVFCKNEACRMVRIIDKDHSRIIEWDGSVWQFDRTGAKWRVRLSVNQ